MRENSQLSKPAVHAQLSVILAIFKANRLIELLAIVNGILLLVTITHAPNLFITGIASFGFVVSLAVFYYALRVRIDQALFERWDSLDMQALDAALMQVNARFKAGKTLNQRLAGAHRLFKMGLYGLVLQFIVLLVVAWLLS